MTTTSERTSAVAASGRLAAPTGGDFAAARGLGGPHAQTIYANLFRRTRPYASRRERLELPDGDFLDLETAAPERPSPHAPWIAILHGLEGSSRAPYVRGLVAAALSRGIEACALNYRGCSGEPNRLARSYHSGETDDVRRALAHLAASRAGRPFGIVGFSIGANLTQKLLGEEADGTALPEGFVAAAAVSPPYDLARCARHLDRTAQLVYRERLLFTLRRKALAKLARFPGVADERAVSRARTFAAFDESFTARVHGFASADDYWERCSGERSLDRVRRELLLVSSSDDPFFPPGYVPQALIARNPALRLALLPRGGHVGFVTGSLLRPGFWAEEAALDFLEPRLSAHARAAAPGGVA